MAEHRIVRCTGCNVRFKVSAARTQSICPKCGTSLRSNPDKNGSAGSTPPPSPEFLPGTVASEPKPRRKQLRAATGPQQTSKPVVTPLGLFAFVRTYFRATRSPAFLWIFFACFLMFFGSALKPFIGIYGIVLSCVAVFSVSAIAFGCFAGGRFVDFVFRNQKILPEEPKSRLAKIAYGSFFLSAGLLLLTIVESFTGPEGLTASILPPVSQAQTRVGSALNLNLESVGSEGAQQAGENETGSALSSVTDAISSLFGGSSAKTRRGKDDSASEEDVMVSLAPQPVDSWSSRQQTSTPTAGRFGFLANDDQIPGPGGTFSSSITSLDARITTSAVAASSSDDTGLPLQTQSSRSSNEIEIAIGLDGRATAEILTRHSTPEPGGTYREALLVPEQSVVWGADNVAPSPGGAF